MVACRKLHNDRKGDRSDSARNRRPSRPKRTLNVPHTKTDLAWQNGIDEITNSPVSIRSDSALANSTDVEQTHIGVLLLYRDDLVPYLHLEERQLWGHVRQAKSKQYLLDRAR